MTDPHLHDELRRFWDDLVAGEPATPGDLDPDLADLIRQLHQERNEVAPPNFAYARQLRLDLIAQAGLAGANPLATLPASQPAANGRTQPGDRRKDAAPHKAAGRWTFGQFATVALVVFVLGLIFFVLGPGRSDDGGPATVPAVVPTVTTAPTEPALWSTVLSADQLPQSDKVSAGLAHFTIPPGVDSTWTPYCCPGPMLEYVVSGSYTVQAEAEITVFRANGTKEIVPADVEVVLEAGDGLLSRNETRVRAANTGTTPVELLNFVLIDDGGFGGHRLNRWLDGMADVKGPLDSLPVGQTEWRLRQIEVASGEILEPPSGGLQFIVTLPTNPAGTPIAMYSISSLGKNTTSVPVTAYVLTIEPLAGAIGSPAAGTPTS